MIAEVTSLAEWVAPRRHVSVVPDDPADNEVIDCAVEARAEYVVTGDAHLSRLAEFERIRILDAHALVRLIENPSG